MDVAVAELSTLNSHGKLMLRLDSHVMSDSLLFVKSTRKFATIYVFKVIGIHESVNY